MEALWLHTARNGQVAASRLFSPVKTHVLVDEVEATVVRHEAGNLLAVLDELHTHALANSGVRLLGLNAAARATKRVRQISEHMCYHSERQKTSSRCRRCRPTANDERRRASRHVGCAHLLEHDALGVRAAGERLLPLGPEVRAAVVLVVPAVLAAKVPQLTTGSKTASLTVKHEGRTGVSALESWRGRA